MGACGRKLACSILIYHWGFSLFIIMSESRGNVKAKETYSVYIGIKRHPTMRTLLRISLEQEDLRNFERGGTSQIKVHESRRLYKMSKEHIGEDVGEAREEFDSNYGSDGSMSKNLRAIGDHFR
jgi:hypothetical protein